MEAKILEALLQDDMRGSNPLALTVVRIKIIIMSIMFPKNQILDCLSFKSII